MQQSNLSIPSHIPNLNPSIANQSMIAATMHLNKSSRTYVALALNPIGYIYPNNSTKAQKLYFTFITILNNTAFFKCHVSIFVRMSLTYDQSVIGYSQNAITVAHTRSPSTEDVWTSFIETHILASGTNFIKRMSAQSHNILLNVLKSQYYITKLSIKILLPCLYPSYFFESRYR